MAKFETVGFMQLTKTKKGLKITLDKLQNSIFTEIFYTSAKNTKEVLDGNRDKVKVVMRVGEENNKSCEAHKS